jgi:hypothetical protein
VDELRDRLLVHALENAVKHRGTPKAGAIIGAVMGRYPELRPRAAEAKALVGSVIAEVMGERVALVDSAEETARVVARLLAEHGLTRASGAGHASFFVTDAPERFVRIGQRFLGARVESAVRIER